MSPLVSGSDSRTISISDSQVKISGTMLTINPTVDFNIGSAYKASKKAIIISPLRSNLRILTQPTLRSTCVVFTLKLPYLEGKNGVVTDSIYEKSMSVNQLYCASIIDF